MSEFDQTNIWRRTNLETSDSISSYLNYAAQQNPKAFEVFYEFLKVVKPARILEIGAGMGGLTRYFEEFQGKIQLKPSYIVALILLFIAFEIGIRML